MKDIVNKIKISPDATIKEALKKLDEVGIATLFVCDRQNALIGSLTDGDIRRRILKTGGLQDKISYCFNRTPIFVVEGDYNIDNIRRLMLDKTIEVIPIVDNRQKIVDVVSWVDIFGENKNNFDKIGIPVVIMAGGKGERLGPFTKIFPKPLIPIGDVPIIKTIIDKFRKHDVKTFYITLNYKGEMIKNYLDNIEKEYRIKYIWESEFLGTAGSLKLLPSRISKNFIVSNSDIVINMDYMDLLNFHLAHKNTLTVVGSIQHYKIPYGIIHFGQKGKITEIQEKPELDFTVNTGVYILSKEVINLIPERRVFDMTDLIQVLLDRKESIGVYPVSQNSYVDVGQWEEYKKAVDKFQML